MRTTFHKLSGAGEPPRYDVDRGMTTIGTVEKRDDGWHAIVDRTRDSRGGFTTRSEAASWLRMNR